MTPLQQISEINKLADKHKKFLTKEMMNNSQIWKKFKSEFNDYFEKVKYPQTAISDLSARMARIEFNKKYK